MLDYARYNDYNDPRVISMEDYRLAYYFLSSKVSEIAEIPVSYTHLDVYKRQARTRGSSSSMLAAK